MANMKIRNWKGDRISQDVKRAGGRALYKAASHILNESTKIAPLDEGTLIQTAGMDVDEENGRASVYYTQPYAKRLHENVHLNIRRGRQNKFLEKPILAEGKTVQDIFRDELKSVFRG